MTDIVGGRGEGLFYEHFPIAQGHTQDGQLLSARLPCAAAAVARSRSTGLRRRDGARARFHACMRTDEAGETEGGLGTGAMTSLAMDVLRFKRGFDLSGQIALVYDAGVQPSNDRFQLHLALGARFPVGF